MASIIMIAALAGAVAAGSADAIEHHVRLDHHKGAVEARYRTTVDIAHRQVGAVGPGGRSASLRCAWSANVTVDREARAGAGLSTRSVERRAAIAGSRPGWCAGQRRAIAQEVARRGDEVRAHMLAVAEEDRAGLLAEIDRLNDDRRTS